MTKEDRDEIFMLMQEAMRPMVETQNSMQQDMKTMKQDMNSMFATQNSMQQDINSMKQDMNSMFETQSGMKQDMNSMKQDMNSMKQDIANVQKEVTKINVKIENEIDRAISILCEGHEILNRKLDENISMENRVEVLEHKVSAIEYKLKWT